MMPDPAFNRLIERFLQEREELHLAAGTIVKNRRSLQAFARWCRARGHLNPATVTQAVVHAWCGYLKRYRQKDGRPLQLTTRLSRMMDVRLFFRWLVKNNVLLADPTIQLRIPRPPLGLPGDLLSEREVAIIMTQPDLRSACGLRNRTILEVLYATGLRRSELVRLELQDVCFPVQTLLVRQGKGRKDRILPLGERACGWLTRYLGETRPELVRGGDPGVLFLTSLGRAFIAHSITRIVREYLQAGGLRKRGACHLFRRSMATGMLEQGADIRYVQEMLGHACLSTTQYYALVSIPHLQQVHRRTHPFEK